MYMIFLSFTQSLSVILHYIKKSPPALKTYQQHFRITDKNTGETFLKINRDEFKTSEINQEIKIINYVELCV